MSRSSVHHLAMQIASDLLLRKGECSVRVGHGPWVPVYPVITMVGPRLPNGGKPMLVRLPPIGRECAHCGARE